jgi:hypothetical protein
VELVLPSPACGCRPVSFARKIACVRTSNVKVADPEDLIAQRENIRRDMIRMRRILMIDGQRRLASFLRKFFEDQIEAILRRVEERAGKAGLALDRKAITEFELGANEAIWAEAIKEVLGASADVTLTAAYIPIFQSVAARAYERTSIFIGEELAPDASISILQRSRNMAQQVTRINDTTRQNLVNTIVKTREERQTIAEQVRTIREKVPEIATNRIPTIARTEIGNAIDQGFIQAVKESSTVVACSVVGCKAREPNSPKYRGVSTCNVQNVPVADLDLILHHPNHTGAWIVTSFIGEAVPPVA